MKKSKQSVTTTDYPIETVLDILNQVYPTHPMAEVTRREPYKVLICCILSLRNRDAVTMPVCQKLFETADTPQKMVDLPLARLKEIIRPVQFYESKAHTLKHISHILLEQYKGQVPPSQDALMAIKGVGLKTANLVLALGFNQPAIAVDTHVHRITNRLGYVHTHTPEQTEAALRKKLPRHYWIMINRVMVRHGQEICLPRAPRCRVCPVNVYCNKTGVNPKYYL